MAKKPSVNKLSARYAEAFFALATKSKNEDALVSQVKELAELFSGSPELKSVVKNSSVSTSDMKSLVSALSEKVGADDLVKNLMITLAENRRLNILPQLAVRLSDIQIKANDMEKVHIVTAAKLSEADLKSLDVEITSALGKRISVTTEINQKILGGIIINVGSKMLDNSVRGRLERLRQHLKNSTSKAA